MKSPVLLWLDGHSSWGETAKGETETPISAELECVMKRGDVILIDDARCFGEEDYPDIQELLRRLERGGGYRLELSNDIIRMTPETERGAARGRSRGRTASAA